MDAEGTKVMLVSGKWNSHCDVVRCDPDGNPAAGAETKRLWDVSTSTVPMHHCLAPTRVR